MATTLSFFGEGSDDEQVSSSEDISVPQRLNNLSLNKSKETKTPLQVVNYSEKSIAVFGETKAYKDKFKELGGKANAFLTYNSTRAFGWVFPKAKLSAVQNLIRDINEGKILPAEEEVSAAEPSISIQQFMALVTRVERLEQELARLKGK